MTAVVHSKQTSATQPAAPSHSAFVVYSVLRDVFRIAYAAVATATFAVAVFLLTTALSLPELAEEARWQMGVALFGAITGAVLLKLHDRMQLSKKRGRR
jgi:hypothetical protein